MRTSWSFIFRRVYGLCEWVGICTFLVLVPRRVLLQVLLAATLLLFTPDLYSCSLLLILLPVFMVLAHFFSFPLLQGAFTPCACFSLLPNNLHHTQTRSMELALRTSNFHVSSTRPAKRLFALDESLLMLFLRSPHLFFQVLEHPGVK